LINPSFEHEQIGKGQSVNNNQKIRDRQLAAPAQSETIQDLVLNELKTKKHVATEGLVWLVRYSPLWGGGLLPFPQTQLTNPFPQRSRFHSHSPLPKPLFPLRRTIDLLPRRLRQHAQTAPFLHGEAYFQCCDGGVSLSQRFLCEAWG